MTVTFAAVGAALLGLLIAEYTDAQRLKWLAKPIASIGFVAIAWQAGALQTAYGSGIFTALLLCALGDLLLIPAGTGMAFLAGLSAFLLGHIAFAIAFWREGFDTRSALIAAAGMAVVAGLALRWIWPHLKPVMRGAVCAYVVAIGLMVALGVGLAVQSQDALVAAGAIVFAVSDLAVARNRFVAPAFLNRLWGLPRYYGACVALALTVTR